MKKQAPRGAPRGAFTALNTTKALPFPHFAAGQSDPSALSTAAASPHTPLYQPLNPRWEHTNAAFITPKYHF